MLRKAEEHLFLATKERSHTQYYRTVCEAAKTNIREYFQRGNTFTPPPPFSRCEPCSYNSLAHYSFDMAQQVHYPSDPLQPGPIYFLTRRKCAIFGVCCEAVPRQINYLIDEASDTGKGSNTIVSMLHHFFSEHGLGETHVHLHADNCVGQNKKTHHASLSDLARDGWVTQENCSVFSYSWPYKVFTRLVFWAGEATVSPYEGWMLSRS